MKLRRREFCAGIGALACLPGCSKDAAQETGDEAPPADMTTRSFGSGTSRVIEVRWGKAVDVGGKVNREAVETMVGHAISRLTGSANPWSEWAGGTRKISIKVNCITSQAFTHPAVAGAVARGLVSAGSDPSRVTVWDRDGFALEGRGYTLDRKGKDLGYRCMGSESADPGTIRTAVIAKNKVYFSRLLTEADVLFNIAALKDHSMAGVTLCLKNNFGMISGADRLHGDVKKGSGCEPAISELAAHPEIKGRLRLAMIDALIGVGQGGPGTADPRHVFRHGGILLSRDPVAVDRRGLAIIEGWRARRRLTPLAARISPNPSPPIHIENAATRGVSP